MQNTSFQKSPYFIPSLIIVISIIAIGSVALVMSQSKKNTEDNKQNSTEISKSSSSNSDEVTDFASCVAKTGITLESFPAQCSYGGQAYTQQTTSTQTPPTDNTPSNAIGSSSSTSNKNSFTNEKFTVQGGGQMRYLDDASGGLDLLRESDGKVYSVLNSVIDKGGEAINPMTGAVVRMNGSFIAVDSNYAGGSGNAEFIITSFNLVK